MQSTSAKPRSKSRRAFHWAAAAGLLPRAILPSIQGLITYATSKWRGAHIRKRCFMACPPGCVGIAPASGRHADVLEDGGEGGDCNVDFLLADDQRRRQPHDG